MRRRPHHNMKVRMSQLRVGPHQRRDIPGVAEPARGVHLKLLKTPLRAPGKGVGPGQSPMDRRNGRRTNTRDLKAERGGPQYVNR